MRMKSKAEFDAYSDSYNEAVNSVIDFSGLTVDFFTKIKADYVNQVIAERFNNAGQINVLDVGCGVGNSLSLLVGTRGRRARVSFAGVDVSEACIATARAITPVVEYATYDGVHLPYPNESVDLTFAICVFHHVPLVDRLPLAGDIRRVLKPGGVFLIFEHNPRNPLTLHIVNHCAFDKNAILLRNVETETLMREAGLQQVSTRFILTVPPAGSVLRRVDQMFSRFPFGAQYCTCGEV
jgi:SAM-dependent methyltransferase